MADDQTITVHLSERSLQTVSDALEMYAVFEDNVGDIKQAVFALMLRNKIRQGLEANAHE